ncbi:MAG: lactate/malate family dehydrogenase [Candidatus Hinthialibacter sp.]
MQNKITVVGAGNVGETCALYLAQQELGDVVLLDIIEGVPQGKALDIQQAGAVLGFDAKVAGVNDYAETAGSDIVIITAGLARKPGMDRLDLLKKNAEIISSIVENVKDASPDGIVIMATNPIDVMACLAYKKSGFPIQRDCQTAGRRQRVLRARGGLGENRPLTK